MGSAVPAAVGSGSVRLGSAVPVTAWVGSVDGSSSAPACDDGSADFEVLSVVSVASAQPVGAQPASTVALRLQRATANWPICVAASTQVAPISDLRDATEPTHSAARLFAPGAGASPYICSVLVVSKRE